MVNASGSSLEQSIDSTGLLESLAHGGYKNFFQTGLAMLRAPEKTLAVVGTLVSLGLCMRTVKSPDGKLRVGLVVTVDVRGSGCIVRSCSLDAMLWSYCLTLWGR